MTGLCLPCGRKYLVVELLMSQIGSAIDCACQFNKHSRLHAGDTLMFAYFDCLACFRACVLTI